MLEEIVLPQHWQIQLDQCHFEEGLLILSGHIATVNAACPNCTFVSAKIHSRYTLSWLLCSSELNFESPALF